MKLDNGNYLSRSLISKVVPNYINGKWEESKSQNYLNVENPSTTEVLAQLPMSTKDEVSKAIQAADEAFNTWKKVSAAMRIQPLFQLVTLLRENEEKLSRMITLENGKSLSDALAEVKRTIENVEVACGMPVLQQGDKLVNASYGIDGEVIKLPRGVYTVISPFNFPAMVPFWFIPYAIATGNTIVVKPSEQTPLTLQFIGELFDKTDLPAGVFNIVNGAKEVADIFMSHKKVVGVSMVGSTRVAKEVAETCIRNGKRFQAMGGAKNHLVAMPDARLDEVIRNMITSCYGCAGQRCMASSAIIAVGEEMYKKICEGFVEASKKVLVANPLDPEVAKNAMTIGPVISAKAKKFISEMVDRGVKEGATLAYDGRNISVKGFEKGHYLGPVVLTDVKPGMEVHRTEIFGPVVVIMKTESLDKAIKIINEHQYGNGASIYTQNGYWARKFKLETEAGMIGINVGIPAPVAALPFGGMKDSLFSDIKAQGKSVINFFVEEKVITERYWEE